MKKKSRKQQQAGQAILEYVLVTTVVLAALLAVTVKLKQSDYFFKNITQPIVGYLAYSYKYADPVAQGWDEGTPSKHIQISKPNDGQTFRLFKPSR